jgi:hypothetical protein
MIRLSKIFGPGNSLLCLFDHFTEETAREFEEQVEEISKYYKFRKLSEIVCENRIETGFCGILFKNARKSVLLRAVPFLLAREIPFTLFLRSDCIGMNRLPLEEEKELYREAYPERLGELDQPDWENVRRTIGPFPVEGKDPMFFFSTWGQINQIPPSLRESALMYREGISLGDEVAFIARQTSQSLRFVYSDALPSSIERGELIKQGFWGRVGKKIGPLGREMSTSVDIWDLPTWRAKGQNEN